MPPHEDDGVPPPRPSRGHQPSFSAALLDAIYHSLEADADADAEAARRTRTPASPAPLPSRRRPTPEHQSPSRSSVRSPRLQRTPRPCRVRPDPQPNSNGSLLLPPPLPPPHGPHERRAADAEKKSKRTTAKGPSPFACLLNALLCNRRPARARPEPASRASRRAVRFSPVATVVGDEHGHGAVGGTARAKESAAEAERRVEELLRALGAADERERAKESSESSSDLFELESLPVFQDRDTELPRSRTAAGDGAGLLEQPRPRVCSDEMVAPS